MTDAVEEIRKAMKKEKVLIVCFRNHIKKLGQKIFWWDKLTEIFKPHIPGDIIIGMQLVNRNQGDTYLEPDKTDWQSVAEQMFAIIEIPKKHDTYTSADKIEYLRKIVKKFRAERLEPVPDMDKVLDEMMTNTVDK